MTDEKEQLIDPTPELPDDTPLEFGGIQDSWRSAGDAERFSVGQFERPVEAAPEPDTNDETADRYDTPGQRRPPLQERPDNIFTNPPVDPIAKHGAATLLCALRRGVFLLSSET